MCVLGRLTFSVYLMHIPWLIVFLGDMRQGVWVNNLNQWMLCFAVVVISFLFAIPFSMICEVPFMNLEKYFLMPHSNAPPKQEKVNVKLNETSSEMTQMSDAGQSMLMKKK
uniref:Acyltransferase 3 domain-containing protein n=1 Tax=Euplotes harpa TaxID=151035 RepID=A0A7S3N4L0_9SPIT|mmetsp:Transcript_2087/g.2645  ORF Transcript_2087/g.2645 Transcript_2087/m.2645 type:complete len:111 (+) Transcript_2087:365-697(+)